MDPNAALEELRQLVSAKKTDMSSDELAESHDRMCELFQGLDEWLSDKCYLPAEWR